MASYDYYNGGQPYRNPTPQSSYPGYNAQSSSLPEPPPYSAQQHLGSNPQRQHGASPSPSPFETVFDDHVYPASTHQTPASSQQNLGHQDTGYHGLGRTPSQDTINNNNNDGIPLQDRAGKDPLADAPDHVYEAPRRKKAKKAAVRFGELGMFGANSKRIPWVVYLFSIVQIGVFIGEIVKNCVF